jgi:Ca2+-binding RTX toxin-like protein
MSEPSVNLQPFVLTGPVPVQAPLLWDWSYSWDGIDASGTFLTDSRTDTGGYYLITDITGSRDGVTIIGLEPAGDAIPGNAGYPVDNLISASGQLTVNGFGYETANKNYANPYYANYLSPPIDQEVFTEPASSGFSELPVDFKATIVPGVTVATAVPAVPGGSLTLQVIQRPQSGTVSLYGTSVQYVPANNDPRSPVTFSFDLKDQTGGATPVVTVIAGGDGSQTVTGAKSGHTDVSLGKGNDTVTLRGSENTVTLGDGNQTVLGGRGSDTVYVSNGNGEISLGGGDNTVTTGSGNQSVTVGGSGNAITLGSGNDTVHGGTGDTISLEGNNVLSVYGHNEMVFVGDGNATVNDFGIGLALEVGPTAGQDVLTHFASDPGGVVDLIGGIGGFTSVTGVLSALKSDGQGGTLLSFGQGSSLDFAGVASSQLHAANFRIG